MIRFPSFRGPAFLLVGVLLASGCASRDTSARPDVPVRTQPAPSLPKVLRTESTELMKKDSGVYSRTIVKGGITGATIVEIRLEYEDGNKGTLKFREVEGTLSESQEVFGKTGKVRSQAQFAIDGKTVVSGKIFRPDGTLMQTVDQESNGSYRVEYYWADGKTLFMSSISSDDCVGERVYFNPDSGEKWVWLRREQATRQPGRPIRQKIAESVYYGPGAVPMSRYVYDDKGLTATWFGADGKTPTCSQTWSHPLTGTMGNGTLLSVDEYEADGVTIKRRIHLIERMKLHLSPLKVELFKDGKLERVRHFRSAISGALQKIDSFEEKGIPGFFPTRYYRAGTVEKEETIAPDGSVKETKQYEFADDVSEVVDSKLLLHFRDSARSGKVQEFVQQHKEFQVELPTIDDDTCRMWVNRFMNYRR